MIRKPPKKSPMNLMKARTWFPNYLTWCSIRPTTTSTLSFLTSSSVYTLREVMPEWSSLSPPWSSLWSSCLALSTPDLIILVPRLHSICSLFRPQSLTVKEKKVRGSLKLNKWPISWSSKWSLSCSTWFSLTILKLLSGWTFKPARLSTTLLRMTKMNSKT